MEQYRYIPHLATASIESILGLDSINDIFQPQQQDQSTSPPSKANHTYTHHITSLLESLQDFSHAVTYHTPPHNGLESTSHRHSPHTFLPTPQCSLLNTIQLPISQRVADLDRYSHLYIGKILKDPQNSSPTSPQLLSSPNDDKNSLFNFTTSPFHEPFISPRETPIPPTHNLHLFLRNNFNFILQRKRYIFMIFLIQHGLSSMAGIPSFDGIELEPSNAIIISIVQKLAKMITKITILDVFGRAYHGKSAELVQTTPTLLQEFALSKDLCTLGRTAVDLADLPHDPDSPPSTEQVTAQRSKQKEAKIDENTLFTYNIINLLYRSTRAGMTRRFVHDFNELEYASCVSTLYHIVLNLGKGDNDDECMHLLPKIQTVMSSASKHLAQLVLLPLRTTLRFLILKQSTFNKVAYKTILFSLQSASNSMLFLNPLQYSSTIGDDNNKTTQIDPENMLLTSIHTAWLPQLQALEQYLARVNTTVVLHDSVDPNNAAGIAKTVSDTFIYNYYLLTIFPTISRILSIFQCALASTHDFSSKIAVTSNNLDSTKTVFSYINDEAPVTKTMTIFQTIVTPQISTLLAKSMSLLHIYMLLYHTWYCTDIATDGYRSYSPPQLSEENQKFTDDKGVQNNQLFPSIQEDTDVLRQKSYWKNHLMVLQPSTINKDKDWYFTGSLRLEVYSKITSNLVKLMHCPMFQGFLHQVSQDMIQFDLTCENDGKTAHKHTNFHHYSQYFPYQYPTTNEKNDQLLYCTCSHIENHTNFARPHTPDNTLHFSGNDDHIALHTPYLGSPSHQHTAQNIKNCNDDDIIALNHLILKLATYKSLPKADITTDLPQKQQDITPTMTQEKLLAALSVQYNRYLEGLPQENEVFHHLTTREYHHSYLTTLFLSLLSLSININEMNNIKIAQKMATSPLSIQHHYEMRLKSDALHTKNITHTLAILLSTLTTPIDNATSRSVKTIKSPQISMSNTNVPSLEMLLNTLNDDNIINNDSINNNNIETNISILNNDHNSPLSSDHSLSPPNIEPSNRVTISITEYEELLAFKQQYSQLEQDYTSLQAKHESTLKLQDVLKTQHQEDILQLQKLSTPQTQTNDTPKEKILNDSILNDINSSLLAPLTYIPLQYSLNLSIIKTSQDYQTASRRIIRDFFAFFRINLAHSNHKNICNTTTSAVSKRTALEASSALLSSTNTPTTPPTMTSSSTTVTLSSPLDLMIIALALYHAITHHVFIQQRLYPDDHPQHATIPQICLSSLSQEECISAHKGYPNGIDKRGYYTLHYLHPNAGNPKLRYFVQLSLEYSDPSNNLNLAKTDNGFNPVQKKKKSESSLSPNYDIQDLFIDNLAFTHKSERISTIMAPSAFHLLQYSPQREIDTALFCHHIFSVTIATFRNKAPKPLSFLPFSEYRHNYGTNNTSVKLTQNGVNKIGFNYLWDFIYNLVFLRTNCNNHPYHTPQTTQTSFRLTSSRQKHSRLTSSVQRVDYNKTTTAFAEYHKKRVISRGNQGNIVLDGDGDDPDIIEWLFAPQNSDNLKHDENVEKSTWSFMNSNALSYEEYFNPHSVAPHAPLSQTVFLIYNQINQEQNEPDKQYLIAGFGSSKPKFSCVTNHNNSIPSSDSSPIAGGELSSQHLQYNYRCLDFEAYDASLSPHPNKEK